MAGTLLTMCWVALQNSKLFNHFDGTRSQEIHKIGTFEILYDLLLCSILQVRACANW